MKLICVLLLCALAVSGQTVKVPSQKEQGKEEKVTFLDRLFGFFNTELKPELEKFISKGKDFFEDLNIETKGKEFAEKTKTFIDTSAKKILAEIELKNYSNLFQERLEDGKKIAEDIRKQIEEFLKELREKAEELKGKLPQSLLSLKTLNEQIQERIQFLQNQMEDLQTKANKAYQEGQEKMLKNIEEQLEMVRGQLKLAKEQTKVLKEKMEEYLHELKLKALELRNNTDVQVEKLKGIAQETISKVKDSYEDVKVKVEENIGKVKTKFDEAKEKAKDHVEKLKDQAEEFRKKVTGQFETFADKLNNSVFDMKKTVLGHVETLKDKATEYREAIEAQVDEYKLKAKGLPFNFTDHVDKLKDNMKDIRETVVGHVQDMRQKFGHHMNTWVEKAKEIKGTLQTEVEKKIQVLKGKFENLTQQYEGAMADALAMRKEAEDILKKVMEQMPSGSQDLYEKAKKLATENVEIAKGYIVKVQDAFMKQMEKFSLQKPHEILQEFPVKIPSLQSKKEVYRRLRKKLRSMLPAPDAL